MAAKRHPNDRNAKALAARLAKQDDDTNLDEFFVNEKLTLKLQNMDPRGVQYAMKMIKTPKKPTYEVKLASGRTEQYPMDEKVAEQSPELKGVWDQYVFESAEAENERLSRSTRAVIMDGTVMPDNWDDADYVRRMKILHAEVPDDPFERWVDYVDSQIGTLQAIQLTFKVMRRTGMTPEDVIGVSEDSFRDLLRGGSGGSGDVENADPDQGGNGEGQSRQVAA